MHDEKQQQNLDSLRHSFSHLLAAAVLEIWPETKPTLGPPIEDGFYYDFDFGDAKVSDDDLTKIEKKMKELVKHWKEFERIEVSPDEAKENFKANEYKCELIDEFSTEGQQLTFYKSGEFTDLCRGGHVESPNKEMKFFKLISVAGAYWRGNENNKMLTRIYGTAFTSKEELKDFLTMREEAKKRDHRKLGKELDLFTFSEMVGPGLPLWTPKGSLLRDILDEYVWELRQAHGYEKVEIPHITKKELYETSGHWEKFSEELFKIKTRESHEFVIKPMNCPHHTQIFARKLWSYRELPQRYANTTMCYRDEQTGELHGLSRVRSFTQDDAHVFCRMDQIKEEMFKIWDIVDEFYNASGFDLNVDLSFHDPKNMKAYLGDPGIWQLMEKKIKELADQRNVEYKEAIGEAAFYGPKIDFIAKDSIGRKWQVATIQLDMNMPSRFGLKYTNEKGGDEQVVMIHAAIMGSIERFLSIMIEHFAGAFPLWLSPVQVKLLPVGAGHIEFAKALAGEFSRRGIRIEVDSADETVGKKIRNATAEKVPYVLVLGDKEAAGGEFMVRKRGQEEQYTQNKELFIDSVLQQAANKEIW